MTELVVEDRMRGDKSSGTGDGIHRVALLLLIVSPPCQLTPLQKVIISSPTSRGRVISQ